MRAGKGGRLPFVRKIWFYLPVFAILKGWFGEKLTQFGMWAGLDSDVYRRIHDVVLPSQGGTTQIDHILVSIYGIFVIETKNMKGWIFGDERSPRWTQMVFRKKSQFQNPLHQNYRHVKALSEFLDFPEAFFHSVVFFIGDCKFKTPMPPNVLCRGIIPYIRDFRDQLLSTQEVEGILARLSQARDEPIVTRKTHVAGLRERHGGDACPKCGAALIRRTACRGANAGRSFFGCSGYPKCRYTRPA